MKVLIAAQNDHILYLFYPTLLTNTIIHEHYLHVSIYTLAIIISDHYQRKMNIFEFLLDTCKCPEQSELLCGLSCDHSQGQTWSWFCDVHVHGSSFTLSYLVLHPSIHLPGVGGAGWGALVVLL